MRKPNAIKMARIRSGLTQTELAERVSVTQATVVQWERDRNTPTRKNLEKIASVCGCTVADLQNGGESP